jgi:carbon starvation protein
MLVEGLLAVTVILACTAGAYSPDVWHMRYSSWEKMNDLGAKMDAFISGAAGFIAVIGVPVDFAKVFIAVVVVGFAMTTLDSGTRLLRYNLEEVGRSFRFGFLRNRMFASFVAVLAIGSFAFSKIKERPAGLSLWELFGMSNQLLAGLGLLTVSLYLYRAGRRVRYVFLPMLVMLVISIAAVVIKLRQFWSAGNVHLFGVGVAVLVMAVWLCVEAVKSWVRPGSLSE